MDHHHGRTCRGKREHLLKFGDTSILAGLGWTKSTAPAESICWNSTSVEAFSPAAMVFHPHDVIGQTVKVLWSQMVLPASAD